MRGPSAAAPAFAAALAFCAGHALPAAGARYAPDTAYAAVMPGAVPTFPADYGSHDRFRTEWWYVTGWLKTASGKPLGFQITFFRTRPSIWRENPSAFSPRQLIIAHAALGDPTRGRLWRDQRIARAGFGLAQADAGDTRVWIGDWKLARANDGAYHAQVAGAHFSLHLTFYPTQPPMLNGASGFSRKGPDPEAASYYYSIPHLRVGGEVVRSGRRDAVSGEAWLDHEWSSAYLDRGAIGWDWIGINLDDGGAVMAFRIRGANGTVRWAGASLRDSGGALETFAPSEVAFTPLRQWKSPRTAISYPIEWRVRVGARRLTLRPLMDDQENDARRSSGAIYWEGAVRASEHGKPVGRGYLELTGYGAPMRLR